MNCCNGIIICVSRNGRNKNAFKSLQLTQKSNRKPLLLEISPIQLKIESATTLYRNKLATTQCRRESEPDIVLICDSTCCSKVPHESQQWENVL